MWVGRYYFWQICKFSHFKEKWTGIMKKKLNVLKVNKNDWATAIMSK